MHSALSRKSIVLYFHSPPFIASASYKSRNVAKKGRTFSQSKHRQQLGTHRDSMLCMCVLHTHEREREERERERERGERERAKCERTRELHVVHLTDPGPLLYLL